MAKPKSGILAILGDGDGPGAAPDDEEDGEPSSAKERALKAQYAAMKAGDWAEAAKQAQAVYDECAMGGDDAEDEEETEEEL
jgi:hypothetical protein